MSGCLLTAFNTGARLLVTNISMIVALTSFAVGEVPEAWLALVALSAVYSLLPAHALTRHHVTEVV